jgi:predicted CXXCH cytochrome family protein
MRTLKLAMAAVAAFAFNANAQTGPHGMGTPPSGAYQNISGVVGAGFMDVNGIAFHAGGVAACDGCHVMHNAAGGVAKSTNDRAGEPAWSNHTNAYLLQGSDQSSTCLICHGSPTAKAAGTGNQFVVADLSGGAIPSYRSPGGDFAWVTIANYAAAPNGAISDSRSHGHNVLAKDFGWSVDGRFTGGVAPGGTFTIGTGGIDSFACSSCHDPHGRYRMQIGTQTNGIVFAGPFTGSPATQPIAVSGSYGDAPQANYAVGAYRILAGKSYTPASKPGFPFPNDPPVAVAPRDYNKSEGTAETRVQYATGMSEWCKNCHSEIHSEGYVSGFGGQRHPAASNAFLKPTQYNIYNTYVSSGVYTAGATLYTSLVPFEQGSTPTLTALQTAANAGTAPTAGATSAVMCLSCHRAHASAFDSMVRWDQNATFTTNAGTGFTDGLNVRPAGLTAAGYYDRTVAATGNGSTVMGPFQRSLCNKCHGKD